MALRQSGVRRDGRYQPTVESLAAHPFPDWFRDAKLGIFVHWGVFAVPAFAPVGPSVFELAATHGWEHANANTPYCEWYWNACHIPGSPAAEHHSRVYGNADYGDFVPLFNQAVRGWDPEPWAELFASSGARYVVPVTKHHDGFLLWDSAHPNPHRPGWQAERDLIGELAGAVRGRGLRLGLYYSGGLDWTFGGLGIRSLQDMFAAVPQSPEYCTYADAHWRELIDRYEPCVLWNDIHYPAGGNAHQLFADYYERIPDGVVNNRFDFLGVASGVAHADFVTPEYTTMDGIAERPWEACRGLGSSFGFNRTEPDDNLLSVEELVHLLVDIVSKNGNLLLNVGPTATGHIPQAQADRLLGLGWWLRVNGEAIFASRPWARAEGRTAAGNEVRFTLTDGSLNAIVLGRVDEGEVTIAGLQPAAGTAIELLGHRAALSWSAGDGALTVVLPATPLPGPAACFRIAPAPAPA